MVALLRTRIRNEFFSQAGVKQTATVCKDIDQADFNLIPKDNLSSLDDKYCFTAFQNFHPKRSCTSDSTILDLQTHGASDEHKPNNITNSSHKDNTNMTFNTAPAGISAEIKSTLSSTLDNELDVIAQKQNSDILNMHNEIDLLLQKFQKKIKPRSSSWPYVSDICSIKHRLKFDFRNDAVCRNGCQPMCCEDRCENMDKNQNCDSLSFYNKEHATENSALSAITNAPIENYLQSTAEISARILQHSDNDVLTKSNENINAKQFYFDNLYGDKMYIEGCSDECVKAHDCNKVKMDMRASGFAEERKNLASSETTIADKSCKYFSAPLSTTNSKRAKRSIVHTWKSHNLTQKGENSDTITPDFCHCLRKHSICKRHSDSSLDYQKLHKHGYMTQQYNENDCVEAASAQRNAHLLPITSAENDRSQCIEGDESCAENSASSNGFSVSRDNAIIISGCPGTTIQHKTSNEEMSIYSHLCSHGHLTCSYDCCPRHSLHVGGSNLILQGTKYFVSMSQNSSDEFFLSPKLKQTISCPSFDWNCEGFHKPVKFECRSFSVDDIAACDLSSISRDFLDNLWKNMLDEVYSETDDLELAEYKKRHILGLFSDFAPLADRSKSHGDINNLNFNILSRANSLNALSGYEKMYPWNCAESCFTAQRSDTASNADVEVMRYNEIQLDNAINSDTDASSKLKQTNNQSINTKDHEIPGIIVTSSDKSIKSSITSVTADLDNVRWPGKTLETNHSQDFFLDSRNDNITISNIRSAVGICKRLLSNDHDFSVEVEDSSHQRNYCKIFMNEENTNESDLALSSSTDVAVMECVEHLVDFTLKAEFLHFDNALNSSINKTGREAAVRKSKSEPNLCDFTFDNVAITKLNYFDDEEEFELEGDNSEILNSNSSSLLDNSGMSIQDDTHSPDEISFISNIDDFLFDLDFRKTGSADNKMFSVYQELSKFKPHSLSTIPSSSASQYADSDVDVDEKNEMGPTEDSCDTGFAAYLNDGNAEHYSVGNTNVFSSDNIKKWLDQRHLSPQEEVHFYRKQDDSASFKSVKEPHSITLNKSDISTLRCSDADTTSHNDNVCLYNESLRSETFNNLSDASLTLSSEGKISENCKQTIIDFPPSEVLLRNNVDCTTGKEVNNTNILSRFCSAVIYGDGLRCLDLDDSYEKVLSSEILWLKNRQSVSLEESDMISIDIDGPSTFLLDIFEPVLINQGLGFQKRASARDGELQYPPASICDSKAKNDVSSRASKSDSTEFCMYACEIDLSEPYSDWNSTVNTSNVRSSYLSGKYNIFKETEIKLLSEEIKSDFNYREIINKRISRDQLRTFANASTQTPSYRMENFINGDGRFKEMPIDTGKLKAIIEVSDDNYGKNWQRMNGDGFNICPNYMENRFDISTYENVDEHSFAENLVDQKLTDKSLLQAIGTTESDDFLKHVNSSGLPITQRLSSVSADGNESIGASQDSTLKYPWLHSKCTGHSSTRSPGEEKITETEWNYFNRLIQLEWGKAKTWMELTESQLKAMANETDKFLESTLCSSRSNMQTLRDYMEAKKQYMTFLIKFQLGRLKDSLDTILFDVDNSLTYIRRNTEESRSNFHKPHNMSSLHKHSMDTLGTEIPATDESETYGRSQLKFMKKLNELNTNSNSPAFETVVSNSNNRDNNKCEDSHLAILNDINNLLVDLRNLHEESAWQIERARETINHSDDIMRKLVSSKKVIKSESRVKLCTCCSFKQPACLFSDEDEEDCIPMAKRELFGSLRSAESERSSSV